MDQEAEMNSRLFHLIDDDSTFKDGMNDFLARNQLLELKKHYNIVSVIGSQSSGKSTLLNNLFGTDFQVMQQKVSRSQTTKGIFVAKDKDAPILVLDVEGTDSKERWDDRQFFAKSTGIFALALSQVLVINIWTNMINNYEGQQLGIIKTIFEMNLKLFNVDQTKSIVFILRDYDPDENLDFIRESINGDLQKLWDEIKKPEQHQGKKPQDLFNIDYVTLSSFKLQKKEFFEEVKTLRSKFTNSEDENYYFKTFDYAANLPIDALSDYIGNIWDTIRNNKDINLPNEKEIISQIRCETIKKEAIKIAQPLINELGQKVSQGVCDTFNEIGLKAYKSAIQYYEDKADYVPKIVQEKKEDLEHQILSDLYTHFVTQMSKAKEFIVTQLDQFLGSGFEGGVVTQLKKLHKIQEGAMQQATSILINSLVVNNEIWQKEKFENEFKMIIEGALESKFGAILTRFFTDNIDNAVVSEFNNFGASFWDNLQASFDEQIDSLENKFLPIMNFTEHKLLKEKLHFKDQIFRIFDHKLKEKLLNINDSMIKKFQKDFRFKENGSPENWRSLEESEIEEKYNKVKQNILSILNIFKFNQISQETAPTFKKFASVIQEKKAPSADEGFKALDDADKPRLLNEAELNRIKQEFDKQTSEEMENAIRAKNQTDILGVPKAVWALLIFFGYDDILRWLSNPLLMTPLFMVIGVVALAFSTGNQALVFTAVKFIQAFAQQKFKQFVK